ncbi:MAG: tRNA pseudouridine(38-40) synthase TruA [Anaerolineales bacterium]
MPRFRAIVEYDGTDFLGFQRQAQGRTVQGELEAALNRIGWVGSAVLGAGRTDTGVHAAGQVIAFDFEWQHGHDDLLRALNANLPSDVAIKQAEACPPDFHPRFDARGRRYRYRLSNQPVRSPLAARWGWQVWPELSLERLQAASQHLLGRHDFAAFGSDPEGGSSTVRTIALADWQAGPGAWLSFDVQAEAFLFRMVRSLVGALKRVGTGEMSVEQFAELLASADRARCPAIAPPQGLCLMAVLY